MRRYPVCCRMGRDNHDLQPGGLYTVRTVHGSSILAGMGRSSFPRKHQSRAALARIAKLKASGGLSARMAAVAAGNQWTEERRAEVARRLTAARQAAKLKRQSIRAKDLEAE